MLALSVALLGALFPTVIYVTVIWWLDRYEKEPLGLLALAFLWGAIPAAIISLLLEIVLDLLITTLGGESLIANMASVSVSAPVVEESAKGIALIALVLIFSREFDDVLDGIVYGAMIGLGFAFTENLFAYFVPILTQEGIGSGVLNILMRSIVFGLNHAFWTGIIGATIGVARLSHDWGRRLLVPVAGWVIAVVLHGLHNAGAVLVEQTFCLSLGVSLVVDWGGLLLLLIVAFLVLRKESEWIERGLVDEVRGGALSPQEFDLLRSAGRRARVRWRAWRQGGRGAYRSVGRYFQSATELAFRKQHLHSPEDGASMAEIERLQEAMAASRVTAWPWLWPRQS